MSETLKSEIRTVPRSIHYNYKGPDINHFLVAGTLDRYTYHKATRGGELLKLSIRTPNTQKGTKSPDAFGNIVTNLYWQENVVKTTLGHIQSKSEIQKTLQLISPDFQGKMKNEENVIRRRFGTDMPEETLFIATGSSGCTIYKGESTPKLGICVNNRLRVHSIASVDKNQIPNLTTVLPSLIEHNFHVKNGSIHPVMLNIPDDKESFDSQTERFIQSHGENPLFRNLIQNFLKS